MKVWISIDMEGISGIVDREQLMPTGRLYAESRAYMLGDLQAALSAVQQELDVDQIVVNDSHNGMLNIGWPAIPNGVELISGATKQWSMAAGAKGSDVAFFIGYHAMSGARDAVMDHTYSGDIHHVRLNGMEVGETGLNAALLGHWGVPVAVITGDDKLAEEAHAILPEASLAVVKVGLSRRSARLLPLDQAYDLIGKAVHEGLAKARQGIVKPWRIKSPLTLEVGFMTSDMCDRAANCPGSYRIGGREVGFKGANMEEIFRAFYSMMIMGSGRPIY